MPAVNGTETLKAIVIGVGGLAASNSPGAVIKTLGLGSCIGVVLLEPNTRTIGMVHVALPDSAVCKERAQSLPGYFADTGIPALIAEMAKLGCGQHVRSMCVKMAGGANVMDPKGTFNIGKRNLLAVKKVLWAYGLGPLAEDCGGNHSRSIEVRADSGQLFVYTPGVAQREL
jgi:chemotaxis protein CheD